MTVNNDTRDVDAPAVEQQLLDQAEAPLLNPIHHALTGPHAHLALVKGRASRYDPSMSPFMAVPDDASDQDFSDLKDLAGDGLILLVERPGGPRPPWQPVSTGTGKQMVADPGTFESADVPASAEHDAGHRIELMGAADVDAILELIRATQPGPFERRTIEIGNFYGIREGDRIIALAGERLHPSGWTEVSGVCTAEDHRGEGLARLLVTHVARGIRARGEVPFLHVASEKTGAIRLYESLGFRIHRELHFAAYQP